MNRIIKYLLIIMLILMIIYLGIIQDGFDGFSILISLYLLLLNPLLNIFRINKKIIKNNFYNILVIIFSIYNILIFAHSIFLYYKFDRNISVSFSYDCVISLFFFLVIIFIYSLFCKKEIIKDRKIIPCINYLIIILNTFSHLLSDSSSHYTGLGYLLGIIVLLLFFKHNGFTNRFDLQEIYVVLIFLSSISLNFMSTIILIISYFNLDYQIKI